jgi:hypothetical protein
MSCHLAPGEAFAARELPPLSMRVQGPTRDHPCVSKSKTDNASDEADAMSPTFHRALACCSAQTLIPPYFHLQKYIYSRPEV